MAHCVRAGRLAGWFVLFISASVCAAELLDPTRPPSLIAPLETTPVSQVADTQSSGLQSILISNTRRAAIIDGKTVELGKMYGSAKLVEVNENNVVLLSPQGRRVLRLFPDVKVTPHTPAIPNNGVQAHYNNKPPVKHKERK